MLLMTISPESVVDVAGEGLARPLVLLGAEGPGLREGTIRACEGCGGRAVRIPINPEADSVNVATAGAVALSWLRRGRD